MKKYFSIGIIVLIVGIFGSVLNVYSFTNPTGNPTSNNTEAPINIGSGDQYKRSSLAIGKNSLATTGFMLDVVGNIRAKGMGVLGAMSLSGTVQTDSLKTTSPTKTLCASTDGTIIICSGSISTPVTLLDENNPGSYSVTIPNGVTSITVEVWGAGGAGYHYINSSGTGANGCTGINHIFASQGSTFTGPGVSIGAGAGKCGYKSGSSYRGGDGGKGISNVSGSTISDGASGGDGGTGTSQGGPFACQNTSYEIVYGAVGGNGGKGGGAPNGGAGGVGGYSGAVGTSTRFQTNADECTNKSSPSFNTDMNIPGTFGGSGSNGVWPGGGGGGAGGRGGASSIDYTGFSCSIYPCVATHGYPGGGSGAYVKATINNPGGNTYAYNVGAAYKNEKMYSCSDIDYSCGGINQTLLSGWGANGRVKITYIP